jgi:hypothetical protein
MPRLHVTDAEVSETLDTEHTGDMLSLLTDIVAVTVTGEQSSDEIDMLVLYVLSR